MPGLVDGRDFRREDGAEPVIGPRFARTRWRLSPGHDGDVSDLLAFQPFDGALAADQRQ